MIGEDRINLIMACARAILVFIFFILYISLWIILLTLFSIDTPQFYIHQLRVQEDSANSSNPNSNTSVSMDFEFKRRIGFLPLRYNGVNITLSCLSTYENSKGSLRLSDTASSLDSTRARRRQSIWRRWWCLVGCCGKIRCGRLPPG